VLTNAAAVIAAAAAAAAADDDDEDKCTDDVSVFSVSLSASISASLLPTFH